VRVVLAYVQQDLRDDVGIAARGQAKPQIVVFIEALFLVEATDFLEERTLGDHAR
jgi:hypothetical protein